MNDIEDTKHVEPGEYQFQEEDHPEASGNSVVLRIARGLLHPQAMEKLKEAFGTSVRVITARDIIFTKDPSDDVLAAIDALEEQGFDVVAVDLVAPPEVKTAVVSSPDIRNTSIPIVSQELERDWDKAPIIIGQDSKTRRDMLKVLRYVELTPANSEENE